MNTLTINGFINEYISIMYIIDNHEYIIIKDENSPGTFFTITHVAKFPGQKELVKYFVYIPLEMTIIAELFRFDIY